MPPLVRTAQDNGWTDIKCYPNGYTTTDSCGCCFNEYAPGWYGKSPRGFRERICGVNGEKAEGSAYQGWYSLV